MRAPGVNSIAKTAGEGSQSSFNGRTKRAVCRRCFEQHKRTGTHGSPIPWQARDCTHYLLVVHYVVLQPLIRNSGYMPIRRSPTKLSAASPASSQGSLASHLTPVTPPRSFAFFPRSSTPVQLSLEKTILTIKRTQQNALRWVWYACLRSRRAHLGM